MQKQRPTRIGIGSDLHRLENGGGFMLGGLFVESDFSVIAHSDGDVLLHALTDAILGALGEGDIGELFPDTKEENRNRPSSDFVKAAVEMMNRAGYRIGNVDAIINLEKPKLGSLKPEMKKSLASLLGVSPELVNVKAKTAEQTGAVGEGKAVSAEVAVLLFRRECENES
ncbi:MAG: 2-C-methyl-D-erythritol 2,4-cyclodiphosphate synthase [Planctomycetes bacterium]|nr:2-C-methyl-D-erythritol 2,4-cyclodiphosphate synthase [Planctomycetota bacterium]